VGSRLVERNQCCPSGRRGAWHRDGAGDRSVSGKMARRGVWKDATMPRTRSARGDRLRKYLIGAMAGTVIAVGIGGALLAFATVEVCDQEITQSGRVVEVCRHLQATDPPIVVAGVVVVAALGASIFTEVGAFGFSFKRDVEARARADDAAGAAKSATSRAQVAEQLARQAFVPSQPRLPGDVGDLEREIRALGDEYNAIRRDMPPGSARTERMTSVVSKMIRLFVDGSHKEPELSGLLSSSDRGLRLAGYAYLYAHPQPLRTPELAATVVEDDKPFGQYWGLRALRKQVEADPKALDLNTRRRLEELVGQVGHGTDRAYELRELLGAAGGPH
jgi:hypothetical protein